MAKTSQLLRQGSNASDAVPFVHRILHVLENTVSMRLIQDPCLGVWT